ncbi:hypothetical protein ATC04_05745 [Arthrobacter sp. YC-RL1]|uniref:hypothetical protein n=1 Tax=Arthrobacter sp. YC-RL1 TaxID=1652545 RepID=UPI00069C128E|nr:hypothetical protein [Arthrobacter sp. YC-RL1]ALQ30109.1 hypothetical protein ATC04_05745 [Arthrobacter sp. YC-RL1]
MNTCGTIDCEAEAQDKYLCANCIRDLQAWINKCAEILPELDDTIARTDNVRQHNNEGNNGTKSAGSSAPLNLDAMQLKINLQSITQTAEHYAKDQHAAGIAWTIQNWYTKAELLISGPETEHIDHQANREKIEQIAPPMPTRQLVPWLRANAKLTIKAKDIRNWASRGKLHPVTRTPQPTYWPHEVLAVHRETKGD